MTTKPTGCGIPEGDNRNFNVCGQHGYLCASCLAAPVKLDDFAAEVSNGWLLVAIKIPTTACAICGVVYTPNVRAGDVWRAYARSNPLNIHASPWYDSGWQFVDNGKPDPARKRALVCADCGKPITAAEAGAEKQKADSNEVVAARVRTWSDR